MPFFSMFDAPFHRAHAAIVAGRYEEGVTGLRQGLAIPTLPDLLKPFHLCAVAHGEAQLGRLDAALVTITEALDQIERPGWEERMHYAEALRIKGMILYLKGARYDAEATLNQALDVAREQSAKSWELRTATTLARLLMEQGRRDDAQALLKPVYDWFTEWFDTPDLIEAKQLLDEP